MRGILLLAAAAAAFAVGGVCMKYAQGLTRPGPSVLVFLLFCGGAAMQARAMRDAEMGTAYLFVLGLESILAFALAVLVFSEPATVTRIVAVALVTAGIALLRL